MIDGAKCAVLHVSPDRTPLKLSFKSSCPLIYNGELVLGDASLPSPQVTGFLNNASFPTNPCLLNVDF